MSLGDYSHKINTWGFITASGMQTVLPTLTVSGLAGVREGHKVPALGLFDYESHDLFSFSVRYRPSRVFSAKKGKINKEKPQIQHSIKMHDL